jgi:hypothetical protein
MLVSLPKCKIGNDVEWSFAAKEVYFVLSNGSDTASCVIEAEIVIEKFDCCSGGDVENSVEVEFKYLVVSETPVGVDESDFKIQPNQQIELTESQISDLNEKLKNEMVRV